MMPFVVPTVLACQAKTCVPPYAGTNKSADDHASFGASDNLLRISDIPAVIGFDIYASLRIFPHRLAIRRAVDLIVFKPERWPISSVCNS